MNNKFKNKYRIPSARLEWWNYGLTGCYYVTICTAKKEQYFGEIHFDKINRFSISPVGEIASTLWHTIPTLFPYAELDEFVIMPDHIHAILWLKPTDVEPRLFAPLTTINSTKAGGITGITNPMLNENISHIFRWYKGRCTYEIRKICPDFTWHSRFHDHIIREQKEFQNISSYIRYNVKNYNTDKNAFHRNPQSDSSMNPKN